MTVASAETTCLYTSHPPCLQKKRHSYDPTKDQVVKEPIILGHFQMYYFGFENEGSSNLLSCLAAQITVNDFLSYSPSPQDV